MSTDQFVAILGAITALLIAVAQLARAIHGYRREVNGRLDQLVELTAVSSYAKGALSTSVPSAPESDFIDDRSSER